ncbi:hypothetical protein [Kitasatospora sp. LaBMicrA B282]|uniref:hypothetical protein n=1 Tax=Kitasatospora sp. LaBMicrA B282 TaxID=3420949 RepID=UPI003D14D021
MPRRTRAALPAAVVTRTALAALAALTAGCAARSAKPAAAAAAPAAAAPTAACRQLPDAVLPHTAGSLTEAESGSYCLAVGDQLTVFLTASQGHWAPVTSSGPAVLAAAPTSMLTAPIGVTPGLFAAKATGTVRLSSQDGTGHSWQVTLVVR